MIREFRKLDAEANEYKSQNARQRQMQEYHRRNRNDKTPRMISRSLVPSDRKPGEDYSEWRKRRMQQLSK